jgi:hypothetical protein
MQHAGTRTLVGIVAAAWFVIAGLNLGNGYALSLGDPSAVADPVARAIVDLGRFVLVGLAILSLVLVDLGWLRQRLGQFLK